MHILVDWIPVSCELSVMILVSFKYSILVELYTTLYWLLLVGFILNDSKENVIL